jgi:uncharacterized repeat protein (TIGR03803 family)
MKILSTFLAHVAALFALGALSFTIPTADAVVITWWDPPPAQSISPFDAIYSFTGNLNGFHPNSVIFDDRTGVLYGTTVLGGLYYAVCESAGGGCGGLFKMNPATGHITTLYSFTGGADGAFPAGALVEDSAGILYGATAFTNGTIFKFDPATNTLSTLYTFTGGDDGGVPNGPLLIGSDGSLYGTTRGAGGKPYGAVFKFNPATKRLSTLYAFSESDGAQPSGRLIYGQTESVIYGATSTGGANGGGTVFKLNPATQVLTTLHAFTGGADGAAPMGGMIFRAGALYGETNLGGAAQNGTLFKLGVTTGTLTTLYAFTGGADGSGPIDGLTSAGAAGPIYGETGAGGDTSGDGTVFKLSPAAGTLTTLGGYYSNATSRYPNGGLALEPGGAVYGAAAFGGITNDSACLESCGVIFKVHR